MATRAATSFPKACDATKIAPALFACATWASASATAATPCWVKSFASTIAIEEIGPWLSVAAIAAPCPTGAITTAHTSPMRAPTVASSALVLVALPPWKSARIITVLISTSSLLGMLQVHFHRHHYR